MLLEDSDTELNRHPMLRLSAELRELSLGEGPEVERLDSPPSPLEFLRRFVSPNKPCIISNAVAHWPALSAWPDPRHLLRRLGPSHPVSLHLTPNGRADSLAPLPSSAALCFASAHVERLPISDALDLIDASASASPATPLVAYAQEQNDCFRTEYAALAGDVDGHIAWASEALGCPPEAVNLWIGNRKSETWFHKDHYENLYVVVTGEKRFLLLPPTDVHRMYIRRYPAASYSFNKETREFTLELEKPLRYVPWCSVDPYPPAAMMETERSLFPRFFNGPKPFECTVKAGEILYLPSMWFHHVRQSSKSQGRTIAVNYWYDMQFDIKYAYFNFFQSIDYELADASSIFQSIDYELADASSKKVREDHEDSQLDDRMENSLVVNDFTHVISA